MWEPIRNTSQEPMVEYELVPALYERRTTPLSHYAESVLVPHVRQLLPQQPPQKDVQVSYYSSHLRKGSRRSTIPYAPTIVFFVFSRETSRRAASFDGYGLGVGRIIFIRSAVGRRPAIMCFGRLEKHMVIECPSSVKGDGYAGKKCNLGNSEQQSNETFSENSNQL